MLLTLICKGHVTFVHIFYLAIFNETVIFVNMKKYFPCIFHENCDNRCIPFFCSLNIQRVSSNSIRMRNRQRGSHLGLLLLASQVFQVGLDNIPPVTLAVLGLNVYLYLFPAAPLMQVIPKVHYQSQQF